MSTTAVKECDKIIAGSYFLKDSSYLAQLTRAPIGWVSCKLAFSSTSSSSLSLTNAVPITFSIKEVRIVLHLYFLHLFEASHMAGYRQQV